MPMTRATLNPTWCRSTSPAKMSGTSPTSHVPGARAQADERFSPRRTLGASFGGRVHTPSAPVEPHAEAMAMISSFGSANADGEVCRMRTCRSALAPSAWGSSRVKEERSPLRGNPRDSTCSMSTSCTSKSGCSKTRLHSMSTSSGIVCTPPGSVALPSGGFSGSVGGLHGSATLPLGSAVVNDVRLAPSASPVLAALSDLPGPVRRHACQEEAQVAVESSSSFGSMTGSHAAFASFVGGEESFRDWREQPLRGREADSFDQRECEKREDRPPILVPEMLVVRLPEDEWPGKCDAENKCPTPRSPRQSASHATSSGSRPRSPEHVPRTRTRIDDFCKCIRTLQKRGEKPEGQTACHSPRRMGRDLPSSVERPVAARSTSVRDRVARIEFTTSSARVSPRRQTEPCSTRQRPTTHGARKSVSPVQRGPPKALDHPVRRPCCRSSGDVLHTAAVDPVTPDSPRYAFDHSERTQMVLETLTQMTPDELDLVVAALANGTSRRSMCLPTADLHASAPEIVTT